MFPTIFTTKRNTLLLLLVLMLSLFGVVWIGATVHVPQYTNMSDAQADDQLGRWIGEQATACQSAGGAWEAGFSSAGCNVQYRQPDDSWYVTPQSNPWYSLWEFVSPVLVIVALVLGMSIIGLLASLWLGNE